MVFNKLEAIEGQRDQALRVVQPIRERLVTLLREQGEQQRIGIADRILGQTQSSSYWKLSVDKMRNVGRYSSVRTNVEI